ncbi:MAG: hypothetical protein AB1476_06015 [Candidatus Hadarchaeota archaeon]
MTGKRPIGVISFGIFLATCGVAGVAYAAGYIVMWETLPLVAALNGAWFLVLAAIKSSSPAKYEMEAFATGVWGAMILGGGLAWFLYIRISAIAGVSSFFVLVGILAVAAGVRAWKDH